MKCDPLTRKVNSNQVTKTKDIMTSNSMRFVNSNINRLSEKKKGRRKRFYFLLPSTPGWCLLVDLDNIT